MKIAKKKGLYAKKRLLFNTPVCIELFTGVLHASPVRSHIGTAVAVYLRT